ncbi:NUDIX hydrolase [Paenibacillus sp. strain BS8-2]
MPEERFDIYDEAMNHIGTATRSETHANGYWHRSFHCWLIRSEGDRRFVRFQKRQQTKDTNPDRYDITAAGHLSAGETVRDAVREIEEELGITAKFEELIPLGQIREEASGTVRGKHIIDREVSDEFALDCDMPLSELKLQPEEVAGVYEADLPGMLALFSGELDWLEVRGAELSDDGSALTPCIQVVRANEFVPRNGSYYIDTMRMLLRLSARS